MLLKEDVGHAVLDGKDFLCRHCGEREADAWRGSLSAKRIEALALLGEAFAEEHQRCVETENSPTRTAGTSPDAWLRSGDAGLSSMTIWHVMTGRPFPSPTFGPCTPRDPADFGRCYRLLNLFPTWRARLPEVVAKYPEWAALVRAWDRMEDLHARDEKTGSSRELFGLMQKLRGEA